MRSIRFLILLCAGGLVLAHAQESYTLRYKFTKGQTYRYADTMLINTTQEMMGQEMKMTNHVYAVTRVVAEKVAPDGSSSLIMSADTMRVSIKNPRMDSTMVPEEMLHKRNRVNVTALGEIVSREVLDSVGAGMLTRGGGALAQRELFRLPILSGEPVKVGGKWTGTKLDTTESGSGKAVTKLNYEYTLEGKGSYQGRHCLKLGYTGTLSTTSKGSMMGMDVFTEGSGTMKGIVYFEPDEGMLLADEGSVEIELTAAVTGQQNMTIPISQSGTIKHVLLQE